MQGADEARRVNAFDWQRAFPDAMAAGGFDAVIGNPPYGALASDQEIAYYRQRYACTSTTCDSFALFMEKALQLLNTGGVMSYIVPSAWLGGPQYLGLRSVLIDHAIQRVIMLPFDVFADAYIDTAVVVVSSAAPSNAHIVPAFTFGKRERLQTIALEDSQYQRILQRDWLASEDHKFILDARAIRLLQNLRSHCGRTIGDVAQMKRGVLFDSSLLADKALGPDYYKYFEGDIYRYRANMVLDHWVEFGPRMRERPADVSWFQGTRILLRRLVNRQRRLMATLVTDAFITNKNLYTVRSADRRLDHRVLLAILNSRLISYLYLGQISQATKDDFPQVTIKDVLALPMPAEDNIPILSQRTEALVERMLELHQRQAEARTPADRELYARQIEATDKEIDALVYELYGLTKEEIGVVEGPVNGH